MDSSRYPWTPSRSHHGTMDPAVRYHGRITVPWIHRSRYRGWIDRGTMNPSQSLASMKVQWIRRDAMNLSRYHPARYHHYNYHMDPARYTWTYYGNPDIMDRDPSRILDILDPSRYQRLITISLPFYPICNRITVSWIRHRVPHGPTVLYSFSFTNISNTPSQQVENANRKRALRN